MFPSCHHSLLSQSRQKPARSTASTSALMIHSNRNSFDCLPVNLHFLRFHRSDCGRMIRPWPHSHKNTPLLNSAETLLVWQHHDKILRISSPRFYPCLISEHYAPGNITIFHLERCIVGVKKKKKRQKWNSSRWTIPAGELPQSHTSQLDTMRMVPHQRQVTYGCQAAYGQSVLWYNMCVNDNVKGYCHASLVTQNTSPLCKPADH